MRAPGAGELERSPAQLDLWQEELDALPWGGRSPRAVAWSGEGLTRVRIALFLRREPQKDDCGFLDPDQVDMWLPAKKAPWVYQGAPLLQGGL